eukprot:g7576.t1
MGIGAVAVTRSEAPGDGGVRWTVTFVGAGQSFMTPVELADEAKGDPGAFETGAAGAAGETNTNTNTNTGATRPRLALVNSLSGDVPPLELSLQPAAGAVRVIERVRGRATPFTGRAAPSAAAAAEAAAAAAASASGADRGGNVGGADGDAGAGAPIGGIYLATAVTVAEPGAPSRRATVLAGLGDAGCAGACAPGAYCPAGSVSAEQVPCPAGRYGDTAGLATPACSGVCPAGHYCPAGTWSATAFPCGATRFEAVPAPTAPPQPAARSALLARLIAFPGAGAALYCPAGSALPLVAPPGFFTVDADFDAAAPAPAGALRGLSAGSAGTPGLGHYDVHGATGAEEPGARVQPVTAAAAAAAFAAHQAAADAALSAAPAPAATAAAAAPPAPLARSRRAAMVECPRGFACRDGVRAPCAAGRYGDADGLVRGAGGDAARCGGECCSGECPAGWRCAAATPFPRGRSAETACGHVGVYCPAGTGADARPVSHGHYSHQGAAIARHAQAPCAAGSWCAGGVRRACPPGRYGSAAGLASDACSGSCGKGYFCPAGSTRPTQRPCPAGRYGAHFGNKDAGCSGPCAAGYFCPERSTSPAARPCGSWEYFCPPGSPLPRAVQPGHYATGGNETTHTAQAPCRVHEDSPTARGCPDTTVGTLSAAAVAAEAAFHAASAAAAAAPA